MSENTAVNDFDLPWCQAIEEDPTWERTPADSMIVKASTENALTAELLHSERGIRDVRSYFKYGNPDAESPEERRASVEEAHMIFSLGVGISGAVKRCHGGFISLMVDEVTGEVAARALRAVPMATSEMHVSYKRMIMLPAVVLCKSWITGREGRKLQLSCTIEDGNGRVYATGEVTFVKLNPRI